MLVGFSVNKRRQRFFAAPGLRWETLVWGAAWDNLSLRLPSRPAVRPNHLLVTRNGVYQRCRAFSGRISSVAPLKRRQQGGKQRDAGGPLANDNVFVPGVSAISGRAQTVEGGNSQSGSEVAVGASAGRGFL